VGQGPAAAELHGLLEWRSEVAPPRVLLHNGGLRQRLAALAASAAWQPELLPLERIESALSGSDQASEVAS